MILSPAMSSYWAANKYYSYIALFNLNSAVGLNSIIGQTILPPGLFNSDEKIYCNILFPDEYDA
jgi:hypothetical protein